MTDGLGTVSYNYNTLSQLSSETRTFTNVPGSFTLSYGYNLGGELTSVTNPWNAQVGYNYDKMGRPTAVTGSGYGGVSSYVNSLGYRAFGLKQMGYANGKTLSINYDNRMRMTRWDVAGVLGSDYEYRWEDTFRPTMARSRTDATLDRWYNYDNVGRLHIGRSGGEARQAYGEAWNGLYDGPYSMGVYYDVWGNITLKEGWGGDNPAYTASYTNNRRNGLGYDAAGNLTNDGGQSFTYDATGQQATASYGSLQQSYDGDRLRGKKIDNGTTTYYLRSSVLGGQVVAEMNSSGAFTRGYAYLGGQLLAVQQNSAVSWVHQDPVTKSQRVTNSAGTVVSTIELDPWGGNTNRNNNDAFQPRKFTTYERDANASDEAMHRRYNRWWSRFDQPDPYDGSYDAGDPQSFNRYSYVQNDPVNFVDPSGLMPCIDTIDPATGTLVCIGGGTVGSVTVYASRADRIIESRGANQGVNYGLGGNISLRPLTTPRNSISQDKPILERNLARDPKNSDIYDKCLRNATADQLGLAELLMGLANTPLPKRALGLPVTRGASEVTNPISYGGHRLFRGANLPFRVLGTNRIAGVLGRMAPLAGLALTAWDFSKIMEKTNDCYNRETKSK
jgi:RHS repeat-associated protein